LTIDKVAIRSCRGGEYLVLGVANTPAPRVRPGGRGSDLFCQESRYDVFGSLLGLRVPASVYHASSRRLGEDDRPLSYPAGFLVKTISPSGHLNHEGHHYFVGDVFAGKTVALYLTPEGTTELHFANVHLGNLAFGSEGGRFRPSAYIARPPNPSPSTPQPSLDYQIYLSKVSPMSPDRM
jgi:hypothetical protein